MTLSLELTRCRDSFKWDQIISSASAATVYHTWKWCMAQEKLADGTEFLPFIARCDGDDYAIVAFRCNGKVCLNRMGYGGIAGPSPLKIRFADLEAQLSSALGAPVGRAVLPPGLSLAGVRPGRDGWVMNQTYVISLPRDYSQLWKSIECSTRADARYGLKRGLSVRDVTSEYWPLLAQLENDLLKEKGAEYQIPLEFWLTIEKAFRSTGLRTYGAFAGEELVGGAAVINWRDTVYFLISVRTAEGRKLKVGHAIFGAVLERGCLDHLSIADFGAAPTENLARPKRDWGGREQGYLVFDRSQVAT